MKIYFDNDGLLNIKEISGKNIWITNKTDGLWMYGTLPEKIYPTYVDQGLMKFEIPIKHRKYGDNWQINGLYDKNEVITGAGIELLSNNPLQIQLHRDKKIDDIKVKNIETDTLVLTRPLLTNEVIVAKRRINTNHGGAYFSNQYVLNESSKHNTCFIDIPDIVNSLHIIEEDIIDFFIKDSVHETRLIMDNPTEIRSDNDDVGTSYKLYRNGLKSLSIYFYAKKAIYAQKIQWVNENLTITFEDDKVSRNISEIMLVETTKKAADSSVRVAIPLHSTVIDNSIVIDDDLISSEIKRRNKFSFRLLFSYNHSKIKNQFWTKKAEELISEDKFELKNISVNNFLSLELTSKKREKVLKIAVLGSSHTRPMFTSSEFFNPDYKNYFQVVYTQFHSSIISLVGEGRHFKEEYFETRNPTVHRYLRTDFEKKFFDEIANSNPDYLIIDIYIDVQMGVIYFGDGSVISYNSYQAESNYVLDNMDENTRLSTIFNDETYIDKFSLALQKFKTDILNIIPEDRIILHAFDMSEDYKDENGKIMKYKQSKDSIIELNEIAVAMQSLLELTFPKAKVLDLRDSKYHGGVDNPLGNMPHHFESDYYKSLMYNLIKLISL
ncbi:DUF6270 domain-containing protein [Weissella paramesenteroides]|uniref:DUF6270 domain-containing protein n=1 Tax=Weissella paramesenteroides TaxID=1249 RepID=UPI0038906561